MIKKKEKRITNAELLESINRSFSKVEAKMATKDDIRKLENDISGIKNQLEGTNRMIDDLSENRVKYAEHNALVKRVEILERV